LSGAVERDRQLVDHLLCKKVDAVQSSA
jgi:hypothetical protein